MRPRRELLLLLRWRREWEILLRLPPAMLRSQTPTMSPHQTTPPPTLPTLLSRVPEPNEARRHQPTPPSANAPALLPMPTPQTLTETLAPTTTVTRTLTAPALSTVVRITTRVPGRTSADAGRRRRALAGWIQAAATSHTTSGRGTLGISTMSRDVPDRWHGSSEVDEDGNAVVLVLQWMLRISQSYYASNACSDLLLRNISLRTSQ